MWISREHYESMFENLSKARGENAVLKARIAHLMATQDWLTAHVNRLEVERRILTESRLGMSFPVPSIEKVDEPSQPTPGVDAGSMHGTPHDSLPLAQMLSASLEDVGDDMAARLGLGHDDTGQLIFK